MKGVPEEAVDIVTASITKSTTKQYESALSPWFKYCNLNKLNCYKPTRSSILSFLTQKFNEGSSYGTLNSARSAISLISGEKIGEDDTICRFLKGVSKLRPPRPKYEYTWDVNIVLKYLEKLYPLDDLTLKDLTFKTVMLLVLSTAHRAQTIANIKVENIKGTDAGLLIHITDQIKTSAPGRYQPLLSLPFFEENPKLCVASSVLKYIERTKDLRASFDKLFIAFRKPHNDVCAQSISRWIKSILGESGIDTSIFTAHSTRHASTSRAFTSGVDIDTIRRTAGWSKESQTFARFYNREIVTSDNNKFALAILSKNKN